MPRATWGRARRQSIPAPGRVGTGVDTTLEPAADLGLIAPQSGVYGLTIDPVRMRLYGTSEQGHFLIFDIAGKTMLDKGRVNRHAPSAARTIVIDDEGNVYGTYCPNRIFKYDVDNDKLLDLSVQIPFDPTAVEQTRISIAKTLMRAGVVSSGLTRKPKASSTSASQSIRLGARLVGSCRSVKQAAPKC
ncbi:MAG: hypothetical protein ACE15E_21070 [Acidobacteriota bacterium]